MKLKIPFILLAFALTSCSQFPSDEEIPVTQWTDDQLFEKAKYDFDNQNYDQSRQNLETLAKKNNKEAQYALGYQYYYGLGVEKNNALAQDYIRQSADQGYKPAIRALRQFVINNSTFVVDTKTPSYLALNKSSNTADNNKVAIADSSSETNDSLDQLLEDSNNKPKINTDTKTTLAKAEQAKTFNSDDQHGFGEIAPATPAVVTPNPDSVKPKQPELKNSQHKLAKNTVNKNTAKTKPQAQVAQKPKTNATEGIWDNTANLDTDEAVASVISKIDTDKPFQENEDAILTSPLEDNAVNKPIETSNSADAHSNWLKSQNPEHYTIQVTASSKKADIDKFIILNNLQNKANTFSYLYNNQTWYGAGFGSYNKPADAYQALLEDMPSNLKLKKPWVRQFKNIVPANAG